MQSRDQKNKMKIYAHAVTSNRHAEYIAAGLDPRFANFTQSVQRAQEIVSAGLTFDQWLPWRQSNWDVSKYEPLTPAAIARWISRGMTPTDAKRELSRTYPAPMRTR